eukprot:14477907-Heterocapsa_arctica.AAC.1
MGNCWSPSRYTVLTLVAVRCAPSAKLGSSEAGRPGGQAVCPARPASLPMGRHARLCCAMLCYAML